MLGLAESAVSDCNSVLQKETMRKCSNQESTVFASRAMWGGGKLSCKTFGHGGTGSARMLEGFHVHTYLHMSAYIGQMFVHQCLVISVMTKVLLGASFLFPV